MIPLKDFPEFAPTAEKTDKPSTPKAVQKLAVFAERKFGSDSAIVKLIRKIRFPAKDETLTGLTGLKERTSSREKINLILTIVLIIVLFLSWKNGPALMKEMDQLKKDLKEQAQMIEMEEKNNGFLEKLASDESLSKNINKVYTAIPDADEKAEEVIAMLEDVAAKNRMMIDSISIKAVSDSQFYYNDMVGVVQPYEYTFSVESQLPNILSFINMLRKSLRLMDIMTVQIEEGKGTYKATLTLFAYNMVDDNPDSK
ncbi:hypothetical protein JXA05_04630 [Candidatus Peregrinibacteria bacterium]|nr:hypothetical protein [Candidatus Peregrinibacteria bacterium]